MFNLSFLILFATAVLLKNAALFKKCWNVRQAFSLHILFTQTRVERSACESNSECTISSPGIHKNTSDPPKCNSSCCFCLCARIQSASTTVKQHGLRLGGKKGYVFRLDASGFISPDKSTFVNSFSS